MEYVENYKYLRCWVNEFGDNIKTVEALTSAAGRSYGRLIGIVRKIGDLEYNSFRSLYDSYILSVAAYAVGVWSFKDYSAPRVLQNKVSIQKMWLVFT